jgi:pyruvate/2-oxoglutarate dehydrogenase complex dihydrolipoamide acyltransferase (E2) component
MGSINGRSLSLSIPRRFICDLLHAARRTPTVTFERRIDVSAVIAARKHLKQPPSWAVLFAKGFAIVADRLPEFRRAYLPLPWPHLWQAETSIAAIAVERDFHGEPGVFFGMLKSPQDKPLEELADKLQEWKTKPLDEVAMFRRVFRYTRLPLPIRRFLWWCAVSWSGKVKARNFGTFGISLTGAAGATATNLIAPVTTSLNCGVIQPDGTVDLRLHFDHRVLDGMTAARALTELEDVLRSEIVLELAEMSESDESEILNNRSGRPQHAGERKIER